MKIPWAIRRQYYKLRFFKTIWNSYCAPWEWVDGIVEINMKSFEDFYTYGALEIISWDSDECHKEARQKMEEIHIWLTQTRKQRENEINVLRDTWYEHRKSWTEKVEGIDYVYEMCHVTSNYGEYLFKLLLQHEELFEREKEEALIKLISIRKFLWT